MARNIGTPISDAVDEHINDGKVINVGIGLYLDIDGDPAYIHSGEGVINFNGHDWQGVGSMGEFSGINEGSGDADYQIKAVLNHIPNAAIPDFLDELATNNQVGRVYEMYFILYPDDGSILFYKLSAGYIDKTTFKDGEETGSIEQILSNETTTLKQKFYRRLAHQTQQELYPTDKFLEYLSDTKLQEITWGAETSTVGKSSGRPSYTSGNEYDCFSLDMWIARFGGEYISVKDIRVGDVLKSANAPRFISCNKDYLNDKCEYLIDHLYTDAGYVTTAKIITVPNYFLIDNEIKVTGYHPFVVNRNGIWQWLRVSELVAGDRLVDQNYAMTVLQNIEFIDREIEVMKISVDNVHNYFGGMLGKTYLGHNK